MGTYVPKVRRPDDGDTLQIADSGYLKFGTDNDITITFDGTSLVITGLPTSDPGTEGALWLNSNVLTLSAGAGGSGS